MTPSNVCHNLTIACSLKKVNGNMMLLTSHHRLCAARSGGRKISVKLFLVEWKTNHHLNDLDDDLKKNNHTNTKANSILKNLNGEIIVALSYKALPHWGSPQTKSQLGQVQAIQTSSNIALVVLFEYLMLYSLFRTQRRF